MWAEYDRDTYYWLKQGHFCTKCRKQDAYTLNGRSLCYECSVKDAKRHRDKRISNNKEVRKHDREHRNSLIEKGICPKCKSRPLTKGYKSCAYCRAKIRKQNHKHNLKKGCIPREMKYSLDLCVTCGKPLDGQIKVNGEPSHLCSKCYQKASKHCSDGAKTMRFLYSPVIQSENSLKVYNEMYNKYINMLKNGEINHLYIEDTGEYGYNKHITRETLAEQERVQCQ